MSFRGGGRGFATGANRGGNFGSRGGTRTALRGEEKLMSFSRLGRGGFQQSFGPPAQVLGIYNVSNVGGSADISRNGLFHALLRRRDAVRIDQSQDPLLQCAYLPGEQGRFGA